MQLTYLIILTILGWGIGSFFYKPANDQMHPFMVTSIATCMYILATPIIFFFIKFDKTITFNGFLCTLVGTVMMGIGSLAYYFAIKKGGVGIVAFATSFYPIVTLILSYLFLGETITFKNVCGMLLAFLGIYFMICR